MYAQRGAAQYRAVSSHGLVAAASPTRLVQIMFEQILEQLAAAQGCIARIRNNLPLADVIAKGKALGKAIRLIDQLNNTLDMERGQQVAENLRALYVYMLARLTLANATNDANIVAEVASLILKVKSGWDQIVDTR
ncbi:MAG TPA: flagellar export chaperone FliS [Steroidobacteraceae bacterium]|jgi:flagellar protein FliS|nr:flagellar export chaperone FliS [Steroidobacteraceae bacterium]